MSGTPTFTQGTSSLAGKRRQTVKISDTVLPLLPREVFVLGQIYAHSRNARLDLGQHSLQRVVALTPDMPHDAPMSLLKSEPAAPIRTLDELLATAFALEHEAAIYYADFAKRAEREGLPDLARLFESLAEEEREHERHVEEWSQRQLGRLPASSVTTAGLPQTFDIEGLSEVATSRVATAYTLLSIAVRNEDRAFSLWSYIAAQAEADDVREGAETMARQELQHAWQLRRERRQAYHAEGRRRSPVAGNAASLRQCGSAEAFLAMALEQAAERAAGNVATQLRHLAAESRSMAGQLHASGAAADMTSQDVVAVAEMLADRYLEIADNANDEGIVAEAQGLAQRAVLRLASLRDLRRAGA